MAAAQVMSGQSQADDRRRRRKHEPRADGLATAAPGRSIRRWRFRCYFVPQGISADLIATKYGFSRDDVDAYAVESAEARQAAWEAGYFKKSVVPVKDQNGRRAAGPRRA